MSNTTDHLSFAARRAYMALTHAGVTDRVHAVRVLGIYAYRRLLTDIDIDAILSKYKYEGDWTEQAEEAYRRLLTDIGVTPRTAQAAGHYRGHPATYWAAQADSLAARLAAAEDRTGCDCPCHRVRVDLAPVAAGDDRPDPYDYRGEVEHSTRVEQDVVWYSVGDRVRYSGPATGGDPDSMLMAGDTAIVVCPNRDMGDPVAVIRRGAATAVVVAPGHLDWLDPEQDVIPPAGDPVWVDRAVAAILAWEPDLNSANMAPGEAIDRLLSTWRWAERLSSSQIDEIIDIILRIADDDREVTP